MLHTASGFAAASDLLSTGGRCTPPHLLSILLLFFSPDAVYRVKMSAQILERFAVYSAALLTFRHRRCCLLFTKSVRKRVEEEKTSLKRARSQDSLRLQHSPLLPLSPLFSIFLSHLCVFIHTPLTHPQAPLPIFSFCSLTPLLSFLASKRHLSFYIFFSLSSLYHPPITLFLSLLFFFSFRVAHHCAE